LSGEQDPGFGAARVLLVSEGAQGFGECLPSARPVVKGAALSSGHLGIVVSTVRDDDWARLDVEFVSIISQESSIWKTSGKDWKRIQRVAPSSWDRLVEGHAMPNHVHLCLGIPHKLAVLIPQED
jgi:hypothetical protein